MCFWDGANSECSSNFVQILEKVQWRPWQWLDKRLGKKARAIHGKFKLTKTEKGKTCGKQRQENTHIFLPSRWLLRKSSSWHANQSIAHFAVMFQSECMKKCGDFAPKFGKKKNSFCITTVSTREFLMKNSVTVVLHPPHLPHSGPCYLSLFPWLNICHFDITEVIEAQLQVSAENPHRIQLPGCI
jgi:hypothetical protein